MQPTRIALGVIVVTTALFACSGSRARRDHEPTSAGDSAAMFGDVADAMRAALTFSIDARLIDATPAPPTYDLDADLTAREQVARDVVGAKVALARVEGIFLVVGAGMSRSAFDRALAVIEKTVAAFLNQRFDVLPVQAVEIYLFASERPYEKYCDEHYGGCGTPYGVYYHADRRIVMNIGPGIGTLTHELVHPIMDADFPRAPEWINEGIASLFERPSYPKAGEITGKTNWRLPRLKQAIRSKTERELATLPQLFGMTDDVFRGDDEDLHYSMARYLAQWLDEQELLWPFYRRWRDNVDDDPTGEASFVAIVGNTPEQANAAWVKWAKGL